MPLTAQAIHRRAPRRALDRDTRHLDPHSLTTRTAGSERSRKRRLGMEQMTAQTLCKVLQHAQPNDGDVRLTQDVGIAEAIPVFVVVADRWDRSSKRGNFAKASAAGGRTDVRPPKS
jgi:hypothetical protein